MNAKLIMLILVSAMLSSCASMHKGRKAPVSSTPATGNSYTKPAKDDDPPITEVREKIVATPDHPADPHEYFVIIGVIIGSFRDPGNARKYQEQIASDGFSSVLLKNDQGLYRVSVKATNEILEARSSIRDIRSRFRKYEDTWLLISVK